jgi:hypothetical protein
VNKHLTDERQGGANSEDQANSMHPLRQCCEEARKHRNLAIADLADRGAEVVEGMENFWTSGHGNRLPFKREDVRFTFLALKPDAAPAVLPESMGE